MFSRQQNNLGASSGNLVEFRAGRMNMAGKMVHPDSRKGQVYMTQSEDGLMHFCWKDRSSGDVEDDLIVFPDEFEFKRVDQCKTGRVYVLKFKTSSRRMFFWMQEPKTDKDEEYCRRVNDLMNNPPTAAQRAASDNGDGQYVFNNLSHTQLMSIFNGVNQMGLNSMLGAMNRIGSDALRTPLPRNANSTATAGAAAASGNALTTPENTVAPRTPTAPKGKGSKTNTSVNYGNSGSTAGKETILNTNAPFADPSQAYLSNLFPDHGAGRSLNIDLSTAITGSEAINQLISDPERVNMLSVHLPESEDKDEDRKQQIKDHINSPQFQQALSQFSNALQSAQLGPVVSQFELSSEAIAAAYSGNLEDFVLALEKSLPRGTKITDNSAANDIPSTLAVAESKVPKQEEAPKTKGGDNNATEKKEDN